MWNRRSRALGLGGGGWPAASVARPTPDAAGRALGTRAARFGDVPNGTRVRIYGTAREGGALLSSPLLNRVCVAYRLVVEEPGWHSVLERSACAPFLVQDGDVPVSVRGPFIVYHRADYEWDFGNDVQERIARLVDAAVEPGRSARGQSAPADEIYCRNYRYFEALIRPGDRVTVEGFASVAVHPAGERDSLRAPPLLHSISGTPERPVIVSVPEPGSVAP